MRKFHYKGRVTKFGNYFCFYDGFTTAKSEAQALNNIRGRIKREHHLAMSSKIEVNKKYLEEII